MCTSTQFTTLEKNTTTGTISLTASEAALWILNLGKGEERWEGKDYLFFNLTLLGEEEKAAQSFQS